MADKVDVIKDTLEITGDNIEAHNESAEKNKIHSAGNKVVVAKATANIIQLGNVPLDNDGCSAGANVRLQQGVYNQFPTGLFVQ